MVEHVLLHRARAQNFCSSALRKMWCSFVCDTITDATYAVLTLARIELCATWRYVNLLCLRLRFFLTPFFSFNKTRSAHNGFYRILRSTDKRLSRLLSMWHEVLKRASPFFTCIHVLHGNAAILHANIARNRTNKGYTLQCIWCVLKSSEIQNSPQTHSADWLRLLSLHLFSFCWLVVFTITAIIFVLRHWWKSVPL